MSQPQTKFTIGVSRQLLNEDLTAVIPEFDFTPLLENPAIELTTLAAVGGGDLRSADIEHLDAVILFLERVTSDTVSSSSRTAVFARYGVGFDTLDVEACNQAGIAIAIAPAGVCRPVATTVIALMLALSLNLRKKDELVRSGGASWAAKSELNGMGLVGRTLGIVGLGNIGAEVARLAAPFDMNLIAHDPFISAETAAAVGVKLVSLQEVFTESDVLSLNCPLSPETTGLVDARHLSLMKPTSYLINTARGPVVDEQALIEALQGGVIAGAGLDVFEKEPPDDNNPLLSMPQVILSPHALCFTDQCMAGLGAADVEACLGVMSGTAPRNLANPAVVDSPEFKKRMDALRQRFA